MFEVKWVGFDYGQCIMSPAGLRNHLVIGDICKLLGQPHMSPERIYRYHLLNEIYGGYSRIKEGHRDQIYSVVLDDDLEAQKLFSQKEQECLDVAEGLADAVALLASQGIELQIVSELKKMPDAVGTDIASLFLKRHGLNKFIPSLVTPNGEIDLARNVISDDRYIGKTKESGQLYDVLVESLAARGIAPDEACMIGDKPETDINPAHDRGFKTIQYRGYIDQGPSSADVVIDSFTELPSLLKRKA